MFFGGFKEYCIKQTYTYIMKIISLLYLFITHAHTHLAIRAVLAEDRRGKVVALGNIPGNEQLHPATSISQHLCQVVNHEK